MARLAQEKVIRERQEAVAEVVITTPQYRRSRDWRKNGGIGKWQ